jgi:hypothetical protein
MKSLNAPPMSFGVNADCPDKYKHARQQNVSAQKNNDHVGLGSERNKLKSNIVFKELGKILRTLAF